MGLRRILAGGDGPGRTALPAGEFLAPAPLGAVLLLALNDHVLKGSELLPGWLTGKLSDLTGLFFFPLLLTALVDVAALAVARATGARGIDFTLRPWKLYSALALTAVGFVGLELSPAVARFYVEALGRLGLPSATTRDPWDLLALIMLVPAWWMGRAEIGRVPLGRIELMRRRGGVDLDDVRALARDAHAVDALGEAVRAWLAAPSPATAAPVEERLEVLRAAPPRALRDRSGAASRSGGVDR
jgi:hypothetical protein